MLFDLFCLKDFEFYQKEFGIYTVEDAKMKNVIDNHVLKFVWVGDTLMFSQDPLGKNGPSLEEFLKH